MSYQVLARKWRPGNFDELIGQKQTSQALINALESQRLHHAYLFTGTRGVGKTTIARILSKSLNCEKGITSKPCGTCSSCVEISQGNFVDLLEIDAASKTKVEDTRELLENVQYRPTRGRYKVYLIDEVHMLSGHSFNALLKTLEEPPPHVIFLLATTDPQKMPVTVLSRCLQFHLRRMEETEIVDHLGKILKAEQIEYEEKALLPIAKGADGSMRDALSLLDQAIAYCGNKILESVVLEMLGSIDHNYTFELLKAICESDPVKLMQTISKTAEYSPDYDELMSDWLSVLHQIAVCQATATDTDTEDQIITFASQIKPADLQLFYQLSLQARRDLAFAPHPRQGFEMAMLRIIAFKPQSKSPITDAKTDAKKKINLSASTLPEQNTAQLNKNSIQNIESSTQQVSIQDTLVQDTKIQTKPVQDKAYQAEGLLDEIETLHEVESQLQIKTIAEPAPKASPMIVPKIAPIEEQIKTTTLKLVVDNPSTEIIPLQDISQNNWFKVIDLISISGNGLQVLINSLGYFANNILTISFLDKVEILLTPMAKANIEMEFKEYYHSDTFKVNFISVKELDETPKERQNRLLQLAIDQAEQKLLINPQIRYLIDHLDATLLKESIQLK